MISDAQTTQQWQLGAGTAATTTAAAASDSDASLVETCRKWYATEVSIILSTTVGCIESLCTFD
jgi:hypothetical protein